MPALDLLFAAKPENERLHQAALSVLLQRTPLLAALTGHELRGPTIVWEPERGTYDLQVTDADGQLVFLELKVDSNLSWGQIQAQLNHPAAAKAKSLVYLLLGTSGISRGAQWGQWKYVLGDRPRPHIFDGDALVAAIGQACAGDTAPEVRELADAYVRVIQRLSARTRNYVGRSIDVFDTHDYLGYFDELRRLVPLGGGANVEYVPNAAGGFVCIAWEGTPTSVGGLYLQFEEKQLVLKVWVDDMAKSHRSAARQQAVAAALAVASNFPHLGVEPTKGRPGETMTLVRLAGVRLSPDPADPALLAALLEAKRYQMAVAAALPAP